MIQDLRYGIRILLKSPGFTSIAVITLALGIGANTAIFSVINAVVLRPLPYAEADRLVFVGHSWAGGLPRTISAQNYLDCRDQNRVFESTALINRWGANLTGQGRPELLPGLQVGEGPWREIVGIVGHVKHDGLDEVQGIPQYYYPTYQGDQETGQAIIVRSRTDPLTLVSAVQDAIQKIDKDQPISRVTTMMQNVRATTAGRRFLVLLLSIFAGTALALAAIGLYGVIAYSVSRRTHEIGIRMALGAQAADVLRLIIGQGLRLILIGVAIGLAGALALTRMLADLLFDVSPRDPITFAVIPLLLMGVSLLASYLPARRATKVDPMIALRHD